MLSLNYRSQVVFLVAWVLIVMLIFKVIPDKQIASLFAGGGFIVLPTLFLVEEIRKQRNKAHIAILLIFLFFSAIPIFLLRVLNWGVDFSSINLLGISAEFLHRFANVLYMTILVSAIYHWRRKK